MAYRHRRQRSGHECQNHPAEGGMRPGRLDAGCAGPAREESSGALHEGGPGARILMLADGSQAGGRPRGPQHRRPLEPLASRDILMENDVYFGRMKGGVHEDGIGVRPGIAALEAAGAPGGALASKESSPASGTSRGSEE